MSRRGFRRFVALSDHNLTVIQTSTEPLLFSACRDGNTRLVGKTSETEALEVDVGLVPLLYV